jgi:hypothetical protein
MPIAIARLDRERSVGGLARRVYVIEGEGSAERLREAEAALLAANPRLATPEAFRRGRPVRVPDVPGLRRRDVVESADADGKGLTTETALRLEALQSRVEDRFREAAASRKVLAERLADARFVREARAALPESAELIEKTRERLAREEEAAEETAERLREGVAAAIESVATLDELARRAGPR